MGAKEKILAATNGKKIVSVDVPDIGELHLRSMTAAEFDKLMASVKTQYGGDLAKRANWRAWLVSQVLCEPNGDRVFEDGEESILGQLPSGTIQFLFDRFAAMNGLSKEAEEEIVGNSEGMPAGGSPSDLHLS